VKLVLQGDCTHEVKVTHMKKVGYLVSVYTNGVKNQTRVAKDRIDIQTTIMGMLRMEDKCGNISDMASKSRMRRWKKESEREKASC
jgi:hypothetical protein